MRKFLFIWCLFSFVMADVCFAREVSVGEQRDNENRLDSIWRKGVIWNLGALNLSGKPFKDEEKVELPRWAVWDWDLEKYFVSQMEYPKHLLERNKAGYSVVMFTVDTLGLPRDISLLATTQEDFSREVIRLVEELPHCLPCRDESGKRMECLYAVYVPFLPQHYRDRVKADSIAEEVAGQSFVEWEATSYFQDGKLSAAQDYITGRLVYDPSLLGDKQQSRGIYMIRINSYGEVQEVKTMRSSGVEDWDKQVIEIIKSMSRWTPAISYRGKGEYRESVWAIPIFFKKK